MGEPNRPHADHPDFAPPAIPHLVRCLCCGREYESYLLTPRDVATAKGRVTRWCCPTAGCSAKGYGLDIVPFEDGQPGGDEDASGIESTNPDAAGDLPADGTDASCEADDAGWLEDETFEAEAFLDEITQWLSDRQARGGSDEQGDGSGSGVLADDGLELIEPLIPVTPGYAAGHLRGNSGPVIDVEALRQAAAQAAVRRALGDGERADAKAGPGDAGAPSGPVDEMGEAGEAGGETQQIHLNWPIDPWLFAFIPRNDAR